MKTLKIGGTYGSPLPPPSLCDELGRVVSVLKHKTAKKERCLEKALNSTSI